MNAARTRDEWFSIIQECRSSGLSDKVWCREHDIPLSSFYYNMRQLRNQARDIPLSEGRTKPAAIIQEIVPLQIYDEVPVKHVASPHVMHMAQGITPSVCISNGDITITCMSDTPEVLISSIIRTLQTRC